MGSDTAWAARDRPGKRGLLIALSLGFALRFCLLYFSDLPTLLQVRPELSTPVNSWESLLEAHFLQRQHHRGSVASVDTSLTKDFYSVGTIHHSPLTLLFLDAPLSRFLTKNDSLAISLTWSLVDVLSGWLLSRICRMNDLSTQSAVSTFSNKSRATKVAAMFLFNPYTIAVCIARSTAPIETAAILASIYAAMKGLVLPTAALWAVSSIMSLHSVLFLPLLTQVLVKAAGERVYQKEVARVTHSGNLASPRKKQGQRGFLVDRVQFSKRWTLLKSVVMFPAALFSGLWLSRAVVLAHRDADSLAFVPKLLRISRIPLRHGWEWTEQVYGTTLLITDLTPNLGLWWYFFMEMFDHFRDFFLLTFNVHVACYVLPFAIKYRQDPLFGLTVMCGVIAVFKSYPTVADHALFLGLLSLHSRIFEYMRYPLICAMIYLYCTFLSPAFHHLWLTAGSANSNFFYAITLVWALGGGMLVLDAMWAWGRERWEAERHALRNKVSSRLAGDSSHNNAIIVDKVALQPREPRRAVMQV